MKHYALLTLGALALFGAGCERRDGKIIFDEQKAEQKLDEAAKKTGEAAKKTGHDLNEGAKKIGEKTEQKLDEIDRDHDENAPKGQGGGPPPYTGTNGPAASKDAGVK